MRITLLLLLVVAVAGCASQLPRTLFVYSADATTFRVVYAPGTAALTDSLQSRGCTAHEGAAVACSVSDASGRSYTVALTYPGQPTPTAYTSTQVTPRDGTIVDPQTGFGETGGYATAGGQFVDRRAEAGNHSLAGNYSSSAAGRESRPNIQYNVWARVLDEEGTPVLLAGDDAAALRESLYVLLIQDLPAVKAHYQ